MKRIQSDLSRAIYREYLRRGMDSGTASYHAANAASLIVSRMESGAPEPYWTAGLDGFFKKLVKSVTKPFKKIGKEIERAGKKVEKAVVRPVAHEIARIPVNVEKNIIRPVAHWKYLSVVANIIPGYGQAISAAISAAQTLNNYERMRRATSQQRGEFEQQAAIAFRQYQEEALKYNLQPMTFDDFKNALMSQASF